jgi:hypothetical protein
MITKPDAVITKPEAEEFSQTIEQIGEGWFRQLALGIKLGVPLALGLTRRQWSDRIGVTVRGAAERRGAVTELSAEGLSNRAIADVLGVDEGTVRNDKAAENSAREHLAPEEEGDKDAENSASDGGEECREGAALAARVLDTTMIEEAIKTQLENMERLVRLWDEEATDDDAICKLEKVTGLSRRQVRRWRTSLKDDWLRSKFASGLLMQFVEVAALERAP